MSIVLTHDVFCDGIDPATSDPCGQWTHGATGQDGARRARQAARSDGWTRVRIDGKMLDLCPDCSADRRIATQSAAPAPGQP